MLCARQLHVTLRTCSCIAAHVCTHEALAGRRIEKGEDGLYTVNYEQDGKPGSCRAGVVMFGTGRNPNTREIGLEVCPHKVVAVR